MKKTGFVYMLLLIALLIRVNKVCEGDLATCQGAGEADWKDRQEKTNSLSRLEKFRERTVSLARKNLPSPHSELLLGMTVGIDKLYEVPKFKKMLRDTGTIHVVVVSGYNVTLVYNAIMKILGTPYKLKNMALAVTGTLVFAIVSGFEPPVVRAWIMGSIIAFGKFYGRKIDAVSVLLFTGAILALIDPSYIYNLSFQLSFLATLSLILFEASISSMLKGLLKVQNVIIEDLSATLSAQMLIWPFLSYKFGQISLLSPVVNALILWTVPISTMAGSIFLALSALSGVLGSFLAVLVYLPLDFFVLMIEYFSKFNKFVLNAQVSLLFLVVYYFILGLFFIKSSRKNHVK